jgi:hypothetical protein
MFSAGFDRVLQFLLIRNRLAVTVARRGVEIEVLVIISIPATTPGVPWSWLWNSIQKIQIRQPVLEPRTASGFTSRRSSMIHIQIARSGSSSPTIWLIDPRRSQRGRCTVIAWDMLRESIVVCQSPFMSHSKELVEVHHDCMARLVRVKRVDCPMSSEPSSIASANTVAIIG